MTHSNTTNRRKVLKAGALAAAAAAAGVELMIPRRASAARKQKLVYWHLPTFTPLADEAAREQFEDFPQAGRIEGR